MQVGEWIALITGVSAILIGAYAARKANSNASAATLLALNESFRQAWGRFLEETDETRKAFQFAELVNLIEIGSVIYLDRSIHGGSREVLREYLRNILNMLESDEAARKQIAELRETPDTFKYIVRLIARLRKEGTGVKLNAAMLNPSQSPQAGFEQRS